jgi:stage V sporulation protein G
MEKLQFNVERMFKFPEGGALKAFADVSINERLVVRGVRIVEGKKGLFVTMPQEQGKNNKWYDQVMLKSAEDHDEMAGRVLEHYQTA